MRGMRHYANFKRPHGLKKAIERALPERSADDRGFEWRQYLLSELLPEKAFRAYRDKVVSQIAAVSGMLLRGEEFSLVVHCGWGSVPRHADHLAKTCFLVPLRVPATVVFEVEGMLLSLREKALIRFNDYDRHSLINEWHGYFQVLSVTRDQI